MNKTNLRYLTVIALFAVLTTTGCKRSDLLDDDANPNKEVAPMSGSEQIDCEKPGTECKTVDEGAIK